MRRLYDGLSREELLEIIDKLHAENFRAKKELFELRVREKEIKSERPGYKWRWSDERLIELYARKRKLEDQIQFYIPRELREIDMELEYIKRASNGGQERKRNYYDFYDEDLYLKELEKDGYVRGFSL